MLEDSRHERSLIIILPLTDPNFLKTTQFTDNAIKILKNIAVEKLHRQRVLEKYVIVSLKK